MANDERTAPTNQEHASLHVASTACPYCALTAAASGRPYRAARRHRDDRCIADGSVSTWNQLEPVRAEDLSWPTIRLN